MYKPKIQLIPTPKSLTGSGALLPFALGIACPVATFMPLVEVAQATFFKVFDLALPQKEGGLRLGLDPTLPSGGYRLVGGGTVDLFAADYEGARYGLASFLQLVQQTTDGMVFPRVEILDAPDKPHRGFMVDLARWWHPKRTVLAYIDLCFFYKIKYMHLHFADNQSYTLPSAVFPKLPTPGRHYSFADITEICAYAKARGVELIPEIEMPGHAKPLNLAYPQYFTDTTSDGYLAQLQRTPTVVCAGSTACFAALAQLIDEVLALFDDSRYIHLGGDEANTELWEHCDVCQAYMQAQGLPSVKELYSDFTARVTDYVLQKGRTPIVWEGFPKAAAHRISKDVVVMAWECYYNQPEDLLADGFSIINCAWKPLYLCPGTTTWDYKDILNWNTYNLQNFSQKSRATKTPVQLPPTPKVLGAQLCVWEACYEYEIHPTVSNMAAFSQRLWATRAQMSPDEFSATLAPLQSKAYALICER